MTNQTIKSAVIGKVFNASERAEFLAALERVKADKLNATVRELPPCGGEFAGAILVVGCGVQ